MKKIFVIYRENNLYKKLAPKIVEWLKASVEVITFPPFASNDEIRIEIRMHLAMLRNNVVISDETCRCIIHGEDELENPTKYERNDFRGKKENPILFTDTLDYLCDKAIKIACGAKFKEDYTNIRNENTDGTAIISNLLEKIKGHGIIPKKIYVITEYTGDHAPFCYWENSVDDNDNSRRKYETEIAAPIIKQWFEEKFKNNVEIISAFKKQGTQSERSQYNGHP